MRIQIGKTVYFQDYRKFVYIGTIVDIGIYIVRIRWIDFATLSEVRLDDQSFWKDVTLACS